MADIAYLLITKRVMCVFQQQLIHVRNASISDDPDHLPYVKVGTINFNFVALRMINYMIVDKVRKLLVDIKFSERGSNAYTKETATFIMFIEFLEDCENLMVGSYYTSSIHQNRSCAFCARPHLLHSARHRRRGL